MVSAKSFRAHSIQWSQSCERRKLRCLSSPRPLTEQAALETEMFANLFSTEEQKGAQAFLENARPTFHPEPGTSNNLDRIIDRPDADFLLSEEHQMLQRMVRDFATKQIEPHAQELDAATVFPRRSSPSYQSWG